MGGERRVDLGASVSGRAFYEEDGRTRGRDVGRTGACGRESSSVRAGFFSACDHGMKTTNMADAEDRDLVLDAD